MKRRQFITAIGGITGLSSLMVSSGAFNFVNAERTVSLSVADDRQAFLKLTQQGSGGRSETDGHPDTLQFNIPGDEDGEYPDGNPTDPKGVGTDSIYRFSQDAGGDETGLFGISNQGSKPVEVFSTQPTTENIPSVTIFDVESGELLTEDNRSRKLGVGESLDCGLAIDTHGTSVRSSEYDVPLVINAYAINP